MHVTQAFPVAIWLLIIVFIDIPTSAAETDRIKRGTNFGDAGGFRAVDAGLGNATYTLTQDADTTDTLETQRETTTPRSNGYTCLPSTLLTCVLVLILK